MSLPSAERLEAEAEGAVREPPVSMVKWGISGNPNGFHLVLVLVFLHHIGEARGNL